MKNDKNLVIKKKPQEVTDEELNQIAGGSNYPDSRFGCGETASSNSNKGTC